MKKFRYFADPFNFSYVSADKVSCSICDNMDFCFTKNAFYGAKKLEYVCDSCLLLGRIRDFGMSGGDISDVDIKGLTGTPEEIQEKIDAIFYKTPGLPTWQDMWWPTHNGDFCTFVKIASKNDFNNQEEIFQFVPEEERYGNTSDDFWKMLADGPITNLKNGNYSASFYLFRSDSENIVLWDCN